MIGSTVKLCLAPAMGSLWAPQVLGASGAHLSQSLNRSASVSRFGEDCQAGEQNYCKWCVIGKFSDDVASQFNYCLGNVNLRMLLSGEGSKAAKTERAKTRAVLVCASD